MSVFIAKDDRERLVQAKSLRRSGVIVLFDVIGSAEGKTDPDWALHLECLYKAFSTFCENLYSELDSANFDAPVTKYLGDGLFAFFPINEEADGELLRDRAVGLNFVTRAVEFRSQIHEGLPFGRNRMRMKTIIANAEDVRMINWGDDASRVERVEDVLGMAVDYAFRLEKYAGSTHIVTNFSLDSSLIEGEYSLKEVRCQRKFKGWGDSPQIFYILTSKSMIESEVAEQTGSAEHVYGELLKFYTDEISKLLVEDELSEKKESWRLGQD